MDIQHIYEGDDETRLYASKPTWVCGTDDESDRVQLGIYASIELIEDNDHDDHSSEDAKKHPIVVSFSIVVHEPAVNESALPDHHTPEEREKFLTSPEGIGVHGRIREYVYEHGPSGVPAGIQLMAIRRDGEPKYYITEKFDVKIVGNPRVGHPVKEWPWFSDWEEAEAFARRVIEERADTMMSLIGFLLDRPVNMVGQNGWSIIEAQRLGRDWDPFPSKETA